MTDPSKSLPVPAARGTTGANLQKEQEVWEGSTLLHGDDIPKELRRQNPPTKDTVPAGTDPVLSGITGDSGFNASDVFDSGRWMALGPFLLLVFVGLARWWQGRVRP